ncbi:MAG: AAA family ATPase [Burkholderiales bacterium]
MPEALNQPLIRYLQPRSFLSFGPDFPGLELRDLNVLVGANGSGKSNLLEAINLLRAAPKEWREVTRKGGGVAEWIWKGEKKNGKARIEALIANPSGQQALRHAMAFHAVAQTFALDDERVEYEHPSPGKAQPDPFYRYQNGSPILRKEGKGQRILAPGIIESDRSILAQRRDPETYPELAWLAQSYEGIRIYREWAFGRGAVFREPQRADMRNDVLEEDFSNLGLFLNRLKTRFPAAKKAIITGLKDLYDGIQDFDVFVEGGTVQVFVTEGDFSIPATRLSDGTLRYLCLLAILCDPDPPKLICIEQPELGLHPDILPKVADLLRSASERTQLIVTTHSDILVDAMTVTPEAVVVCTKDQGQTRMERLKAVDLGDWLKNYRLGQLWTKGEIGGTRW